MQNHVLPVQPQAVPLVGVYLPESNPVVGSAATAFSAFSTDDEDPIDTGTGGFVGAGEGVGMLLGTSIERNILLAQTLLATIDEHRSMVRTDLQHIGDLKSFKTSKKT